jgi:hypothetical protein
MTDQSKETVTGKPTVIMTAKKWAPKLVPEMVNKKDLSWELTMATQMVK